MFESCERGTDVVRTVTLLHKRFFDDSPIFQPVDPLRLQRRANVPTPHNAFIKEWARREQEQEIATTESPLAELFVIENAKAAKKVEVFVWTLQQQPSLHYAFLLHVSDM